MDAEGAGSLNQGLRKADWQEGVFVTVYMALSYEEVLFMWLQAISLLLHAGGWWNYQRCEFHTPLSHALWCSCFSPLHFAIGDAANQLWLFYVEFMYLGRIWDCLYFVAVGEFVPILWRTRTPGGFSSRFLPGNLMPVNNSCCMMGHAEIGCEWKMEDLPQPFFTSNQMPWEVVVSCSRLTLQRTLMFRQLFSVSSLSLTSRCCNVQIPLKSWWSASLYCLRKHMAIQWPTSGWLPINAQPLLSEAMLVLVFCKCLACPVLSTGQALTT